MEAFKIAVLCIIAAVLYGIVHDQFIARIYIEYFTISHPRFSTHSLRIGWASGGESLRRGGSARVSLCL
jgi:uncharacterized protein YneF (UPF0154 family)